MPDSFEGHTDTSPALETLEPRLLLDAAADSAIVELFDLSPAVFVENAGQWQDPAVRYAFQDNGAGVAIVDDGLVFSVARLPEGEVAGDPLDVFAEPLDESTPVPLESVSFRSHFVGANAVVPVGLDRQDTAYNFFVGDQADWRTGVGGYAAVAYSDLWQGIDLSVRGGQSALKYEFHVAPGVDWGQIQVRYEGVEGLSLADDGSLKVDLGDPWGAFVDDAPYIYQEIDGQEVEIPGRFELLDDSTYAFQIIGEYDLARELIIDPELAWSTYLGGSNSDSGCDLDVDAFGNVYTVGTTRSPSWVSGGYDSTLDGDVDAFVVKLTPEGEHLWSTYLGGSGGDDGRGIAVDQFGNAYVTGATTSPGWTSGGFDTTYDGGYADAFVAKLGANGTPLWSTYLGGSDRDEGMDIAVDSFANAYLTGITRSSGWTSDGFDTTYGGYTDAFVAKLGANGTHLWSTYLGGSDRDDGMDIAVDSFANAYVTGYTSSSGWTSGGFDTTYNGGSTDAFVAKLGDNGTHLWSTYLGGSDSWEAGFGVGVGPAGAAYVAGVTGSADFPTMNGFDSTYNGDDDAFVARLTSSGQLEWSTYLGGSLDDWYLTTGIAVDTMGDAYVTGATFSEDFPTPGGFDSSLDGGGDAYVARFSSSGALKWGTYLGGRSWEEEGTGVAVDVAGSVYVTGFTNSDDFPTPGGLDTSLGGYYDAFVAKISDGGGPTTPPVAVDDIYITDEDTPLAVSAFGVLSNDTDADGDQLEAVLVFSPAHASAFQLNLDGSFTYTPIEDFNGQDVFAYQASDGQSLSEIAVVTINVASDPDFRLAWETSEFSVYSARKPISDSGVVEAVAETGVTAFLSGAQTSLTYLVGMAGGPVGVLVKYLLTNLLARIVAEAEAQDPIRVLPVGPGMQGTHTPLGWLWETAGSEYSAIVFLDFVDAGWSDDSSPWPWNAQFCSDLVLRSENRYGVGAPYAEMPLLTMNELRSLETDRSYMIVPKTLFQASDVPEWPQVPRYVFLDASARYGVCPYSSTLGQRPSVLLDARNRKFQSGLSGWTIEGDVAAVADEYGLNTVAQLTEGSDAAISGSFYLQPDTASLQLDYHFVDPGDGDELQVIVNGQILWSLSGLAYQGQGLVSTGPIDVNAFAGTTVDLDIRLSSIGDRNCQIWVDNLVFVPGSPLKPLLTQLALSQNPSSENEAVDLTIGLSETGTLHQHFVSVDWGDGNSEILAMPLDAQPIGISHEYSDDGSYQIAAAVFTEDGSGDTAQVTAEVQNVAPIVNVGPDITVDERDVVNVAASFTDGSPVDTHAGTIDWGDGSVEPAAVTEADGAGGLSGSHTYAQPGEYTVTVSVTDDDGGVGEDTVAVKVNNLADVSGYVLDDLDNDGVVDVGEEGIEGVPVTLVGTQDDGTPVERTVATNSAGWYVFEDMRPGTYALTEDDEIPVALGLLDGKETVGVLGGTVDNSRDSNVIENIVVETDDPDATGYNFAEIQASGIQGRVWGDFDGDGEVDSTEYAIDAVDIALAGTDDRGNSVSRNVLTNSDGIYSFFDLRPGTYAIQETQPSGFNDGPEILGTVNGVPTGDGSINDTFTGVKMAMPGSAGENYNFAEEGIAVAGGQTATIGFWQNKNGQALIEAVNGGVTSTALGDWLATNFGNMYADLAGATNADVAEYYTTLFRRKKAKGSGPAKLDAQVMATALACYVTSEDLAGTVAADYGFTVTERGVGVSTFNVGPSGAAFDVADYTEMAIIDLLRATNDQSEGGVLYGLDSLLRSLANEIYSAINEGGDRS